LHVFILIVGDVLVVGLLPRKHTSFLQALLQLSVAWLLSARASPLKECHSLP
jgi:hypothetical protein